MKTLRCLYLDARGQQCPTVAIEGCEFCEAHLPLPDLEEPSELPVFYRLLRRTGAALLLAMFLLQFYVAMRLLYRE